MNNLKQQYDLNISELIDLMSILQIKEVKSIKANKKMKSQLKNLRKDLKILLKNQNRNLESKMIRKIFIVGITNLLVWELKDLMLIEKNKYNKFLKKALELNTIRNSVFNIMMKDFNEFEKTRLRTEILTKKNRKWHKDIISNMKNL